MRILILTVAVLICHSIPGSVHPDMAGWLLLLIVGIFLALMDLQASTTRQMRNLSKLDTFLKTIRSREREEYP